MSGRRSLTAHLQNKRNSTGASDVGSGSLLVNSPKNKRSSLPLTTNRTESSDNRVVLIDASSDSLTVTWPPVRGAVRYVLEYRRNKEGNEYKVLSDKLTKTQVRKKNLSGASGYYFRVGAVTERGDPDAQPKEWMTHALPFKLLGHHEFQMDPPNVSPAVGSFQTLLVSWKRSSMKGCMFQYELQMREFRGGTPWTTIASNLGGTFVKKKNLTSPSGYQFRVRPVRMENPMIPTSPNPYNKTGRDRPFSPPSEPVVAKGFSAGLQRWFENLKSTSLLQYKESSDHDYLEQVPLVESLGGKEFVLLYGSRLSNGRCREFTSKLLKWYNSLMSKPPAEYEDVGAMRPLEVVLVSVDENETDFQAQLGKQPWLAIDYGEDARTDILDRLGIVDDDDVPRLVVLNGDTGSILIENAIEESFSVATIKKWRELAAADNPMDIIFDLDDEDDHFDARPRPDQGELVDREKTTSGASSLVFDSDENSLDLSNVSIPVVETVTDDDSLEDYVSSAYNINYDDPEKSNEKFHNSINIFDLGPSNPTTNANDSMLDGSSRAIFYDMSVELIDATTDTLTLTWPATEGATRYILEYRTSDSSVFTLLSDQLTKTKVRKRNLSGEAGFVFRVLAVMGDNDDSGYLDDSARLSTTSAVVGMWMTHAQPFRLLTEQQQRLKLPAPMVTCIGKDTLVVSWKGSHAGGKGSKEKMETYYELQMREDDGGKPWHSISKFISGCEFTKRKLSSPLGYQFRVRVAGDGDQRGNVFAFSQPSEVVVARSRLSSAMKKKFDSLSSGTFVRKSSTGDGKIKSVTLEDALGGKEFVLLYVGAFWSETCKKFTPKLAKWYESFGSAEGHVEVIFVSCDRGRQGFASSLASQPWLAVDFDDAARDRLLDSHQGSDINNIPRLVVLSAESGKVVAKNAADGQVLDANLLEKWRSLDGGSNDNKKDSASSPSSSSGPTRKSKTSIAGRSSPVKAKSSINLEAPSTPGSLKKANSATEMRKSKTSIAGRSSPVKAKSGINLEAPSTPGSMKKAKSARSTMDISAHSSSGRKTKDTRAKSPCPDIDEERQLSVAMQKTFKSVKRGAFIKRNSQAPVSVEDALTGKEFVLLYAADNKSDTCNQFTRRLVKWYESWRTRSFEVVFLSCDDTQQAFDVHLKSHPWLAVEYGDQGREKLLSKIVIKTSKDDSVGLCDVPLLMVLNASTGKVLVRNVADDANPFDYMTLAKWRKLAGRQPGPMKQRNKVTPPPSPLPKAGPTGRTSMTKAPFPVSRSSKVGPTARSSKTKVSPPTSPTSKVGTTARSSMTKPNDQKRPIVASKKGLPSAMKQLFEPLDNGTFIKNGTDQPILLRDALGGKEFVILYASANGIASSLSFTADLADWYASLDATEKSTIEVIFLSFDRDSKGFKDCFNSHPWLAVDYDDSGRNKLLASIKQATTDPPRLVVLHAKTGKVVADNPSRETLTEPTTMHKWRTIAERFRSKRQSVV